MCAIAVSNTYLQAVSIHLYIAMTFLQLYFTKWFPVFISYLYFKKLLPDFILLLYFTTVGKSVSAKKSDASLPFSSKIKLIVLGKSVFGGVVPICSQHKSDASSKFKHQAHCARPICFGKNCESWKGLEVLCSCFGFMGSSFFSLQTNNTFTLFYKIDTLMSILFALIYLYILCMSIFDVSLFYSLACMVVRGFTVGRGVPHVIEPLIIKWSLSS